VKVEALFGLVVAAQLGCASACAKIRRAQTEIAGRTEPVAAGDHLQLSIPFALLDTVIRGELRRVPSARVPIPGVAGFSPGTATLAVTRVVTQAAPDGELGFGVNVQLSLGSRPLLPLVLDVRVKPRLDPKNATVVLALDKQSVVAIDARLGPGGTKAMVDALWAQLPAAARMMTSKSRLTQLTRSLGDQLLERGTQVVEQQLLDDLGKVARIELDLPPLPVDAIDVRSTNADLVVGARTTLPVVAAIPASVQRSVPQHQVQLTLHASAAVELANHAMKAGEVPDRFDLEGEVDPKGPLQAHLAWAQGPKPLKAHAFMFEEKRCAHITLGATPQVGVDKGRLLLSTRDAKIEDVEGSAGVKAGVFFSGVARKSFEHVEEIATQTQFDLGTRTLQAQVQQATLQGENLVLGLTLR
jgi:hypothetical protein